jgi:hypothetical protein
MVNLVKKPEVISGLAILLFCGVGLFLIKNVCGFPSVFPVVTLICMSILALMLIGKALRERPRRGKYMGESEQELSTETATRMRVEEELKPLNAETRAEPRTPNLVLIVGLLTITVMYIIAMDILGFVISTSIYLFGMLLFLGMRRYAGMILTSILTTALIFLIFRTVMYIGLPAGIFDPTKFLYKLLNY